MHREYARKNKEHLNEYSKSRLARIWGNSNIEIGRAAEIFALKHLLPSLGFKDIFHASASHRQLPFDFVADWKGRRILVDVTTKFSKGGTTSLMALRLAEALRFPFFRVFIKPDFSGYMIRDASDGGAVLVDQVRILPK